jgi:hypothetical protein
MVYNICGMERFCSRQASEGDNLHFRALYTHLIRDTHRISVQEK